MKTLQEFISESFDNIKDMTLYDIQRDAGIHFVPGIITDDHNRKVAIKRFPVYSLADPFRTDLNKIEGAGMSAYRLDKRWTKNIETSGLSIVYLPPYQEGDWDPKDPMKYFIELLDDDDLEKWAKELKNAGLPYSNEVNKLKDFKNYK